jgi:hypothetical protein
MVDHPDALGVLLAYVYAFGFPPPERISDTRFKASSKGAATLLADKEERGRREY